LQEKTVQEFKNSLSQGKITKKFAHLFHHLQYKISFKGVTWIEKTNYHISLTEIGQN